MLVKKIETKYLLSFCAMTASVGIGHAQEAQLEKSNSLKPRNVIFILSDDHRYDYMGFLNTIPWLRTPTLDFMAQNGAYIQNAFVTTALSSPSRASILTSLFSHEHTVVDNQAPTPGNLVYFPQYLQKAGYKTAFLGKWHMGDTGWDPQPGFNHWEAFQGQGSYYDVEMNVNGKIVKYRSEEYVTDLLTKHAIEFIEENKENPFFVYLSHKAVHDPFIADSKNRGCYANEEVPKPDSFKKPYYGNSVLPSKNMEGKPKIDDWYGEGRMPDWVKQQRESWHGVDYSYHGRTTYEEECKKYCESLTTMDDYIKQLFDYLKKEGLDQSTLVVYMGDNGFCWGEHGLIDKRNFYEASVRVPMLAYCPELIKPGTVVENIIQNIDIAPTIMEACGVEKEKQMRGMSFYPLLVGREVDNWRNKIFYEYYWEYDFPHTPTMFGVRTERYKYIKYHGIWDTNELYDLVADPHETNNLIASPDYQDVAKTMLEDLYDWLENTNGMNIPMKRTVKHRIGDHRNMYIY